MGEIYHSSSFGRLFYKGFTIVQFVLISNLSAQNSIVSGGNTNETFGENITRMQTFDTIVNEVSLGVPSYEFPKPKPIIKKKPKSFFEKIIEFFKSLINKNK